MNRSPRAVACTGPSAAAHQQLAAQARLQFGHLYRDGGRRQVQGVRH
jgi:hypothetical protein